MPEFHETGYGRRFFDAQLPALIKAIQDLTAEVKKLNTELEKK
jgi:hypothetical protein